MIRELFQVLGQDQKAALAALKEVFEGYSIGETITDTDRNKATRTKEGILRAKTIHKLGEEKTIEAVKAGNLELEMWKALQKFAEDNGVKTDPASISNALDPLKPEEDPTKVKKLNLADM